MNPLFSTIGKYLLGGLLLALLIFVPARCQKQKYIDQGRAEVQAKWDQAVERGNKEIAKLKAQKNKVTVRTETVTVEKIRTVKVKGDEIIKKVEVFVPVNSGMFSGGFRVYHDGAVENRIPDPTEIANAAPTTATEVAATVAENYKLCHVAYETVEGWQTWAKEQCKLNPNGCE